MSAKQMTEKASQYLKDGMLEDAYELFLEASISGDLDAIL